MKNNNCCLLLNVCEEQSETDTYSLQLYSQSAQQTRGLEIGKMQKQSSPT